MSALRDDLFIFSDAIGSSTGTALNLETILTLKEDDSSGEWYSFPMLIDIFNQAGYNTWWLSNQERYGIWSNSSSAMSSRAHTVIYAGNESSKDATLYRYDDVLVPEFYKAMADTSSYRMINIHLMGSHTKYSYRYPPEYSRFSADDERNIHSRPWLDNEKLGTIAEYDNSILFTDYILGQIIDRVSESTSPAVVVYLSDHGENVYDDRDFIGRDRRYVRVPMIVYINEAYRNSRHDAVEKLRNATDMKFSTSNIPYFLMTLSGTQYKGYNPRRDILSADTYVDYARHVDGEPWD